MGCGMGKDKRKGAGSIASYRVREAPGPGEGGMYG